MFLRKNLLTTNRIFSFQIRQYSRNRLEEIERLREGYGSSRNIEENDLSKNIMERIKNQRRLAPSIHDSEFYSASKDNEENENENDDDLYVPMDQTMKINGRGTPKRIKKSDIEIVSMKDY
ncbi:hypothetical protein DICPUDRAFT_78545 [Dictyostelium purpureum]|uniref:Uncharacterized protein n=1 Tax=Dictyostelium purpureum TaxID=5786 RepID=F0ZJV7_DICPU|nr:uncharacterized protein DICPUDRAFT_78545 [Dictyostelium purpureum]EGC35748.1 hypothetical protein DICPUDRAFT_78545 [Dictyostelium purpureum]|eukprot:XP_003287700.1 hypothetical protein DICPUDRAFT_78545 [Dictyostelium purpureum]